MYTFGSPRCGNHAFAQRFDDAVPHAYRVIVDGDIVTGVPAGLWLYKHCGREVVLDKELGGNLIVDPSFVEKAFQTMPRRDYESHRLEMYKSALRACTRSEMGLSLFQETLGEGRRARRGAAADSGADWGPRGITGESGSGSYC